MRGQIQSFVPVQYDNDLWNILPKVKLMDDKKMTEILIIIEPVNFLSHYENQVIATRNQLYITPFFAETIAGTIGLTI